MLKWIKTHKLTTVLFIIVGFFLINFLAGSGMRRNSFTMALPALDESGMYPAGMPASSPMGEGTYYKSAPEYGGETIINPGYEQVSDSANRIVIQSSNLSLLVKDVREASDTILSYTKNVGGFMVNTSYNNPTESAYATLSIRIPTDSLDDALDYFRSLALRVTSENLTGTDVTDSYQDLEQRLATLNATKTRFDEMLGRATTVSEILEVQREIINLQQQIDYIKGQQIAIKDNARLTMITLYLSTDELSLPYAPDEKFRPALVFKFAVRSLLSFIQGIAEFAIWAGVFAIVWAPVAITVFFIVRWRKKKMIRQTQISTQQKS